MADTDNESKSGTSGDPRKFNISGGQDLPDNPRDTEKLAPENAVIDLPDVKDIPGQEHIRPAPLGELADTTISSDDEEGKGILDDMEEETDSPATVGNEEKQLLQQADEDMPTKDDTNLRRASLDNTDNEGEPLNEQGFGEEVSGQDLDIPGSEADDNSEEVGTEDEENNIYSTSDPDAFRDSEGNSVPEPK